MGRLIQVTAAAAHLWVASAQANLENAKSPTGASSLAPTATLPARGEPTSLPLREAGPTESAARPLLQVARMLTPAHVGSATRSHSGSFIAGLAPRSAPEAVTEPRLDLSEKLSNELQRLSSADAGQRLFAARELERAALSPDFTKEHALGVVNALRLALRDNRSFEKEPGYERRVAEAKCAAARVLGKFAQEAGTAVPELEMLLRDGRNPDVQVAALETLGSLGHAASGAVPSIARLIVAGPADMRRAAIGAIFDMGIAGKDAAPELVRCVKDYLVRPSAQNLSIALDAGAALGRSSDGGPEALQALTQLALSNDEKAAVQGLHALGMLPGCSDEQLADVVSRLPRQTPAIVSAVTAVANQRGMDVV